MTCENCNCEKCTELKLIKIPELNIEITKVIHHGKYYNEIMELKPKDMRLLKIEEVLWLVNSKYANELKIGVSNINNDFFFEQPLKSNKNYVAGFGANGGRAYLYCDGGPSSRYSCLGVIFVRDLKKRNHKKIGDIR